MLSSEAMKPQAYTEVERARVAAGVHAWKIAVTARRAVVPERHWRHNPDVAGVYAAARLRVMVDRLVASAVVAARVAGVPWYRIAEALDLWGEDAVRAQERIEAELRAWRAASNGPPDNETSWWAAALTDWYNGEPSSVLIAACDADDSAESSRPIDWGAPPVTEPNEHLAM